jgi:flagellar biosynthesis protein FliP
MSGLENAALFALVAIIPLVVLTLTSFVKLSVVLSLLRNAIGAPDAPSGLVVTGLSLVLTFFVMAPVAVNMVQAAANVSPAPTQAPAQPTQAPAPAQPTQAPAPAQPTQAPAPAQPTQAPAPAQPTQAPAPAQPTQAPAPAQPTQAPAPAQPTQAPAPAQPSPLDTALRTLVPAKYQSDLAAAQRASEPLREWIAKHTRDADRETFTSLSKKLGNATATGTELSVLAPAFITTELREAFVIAILLFVPFLVIDLVVGLALASLGLQATSPQTVALPLKLVLFVAVDGWRLLLDALLRGYA